MACHLSPNPMTVGRTKHFPYHLIFKFDRNSVETLFQPKLSLPWRPPVSQSTPPPPHDMHSSSGRPAPRPSPPRHLVAVGALAGSPDSHPSTGPGAVSAPTAGPPWAGAPEVPLAALPNLPAHQADCLQDFLSPETG